MGKQTWVDPYVEGDTWRCPTAKVNPDYPVQVKFKTGAHHWHSKWFGDTVGMAFFCIYCFDVRKWPLTMVDAFKGRIEEIKLEDIENGS